VTFLAHLARDRCYLREVIRSVVLVGLLASAASAERYAPKARPTIEAMERSKWSSFADPVAFLYAAYIDQSLGTATAGAGAMVKQGDPGLAAGDAHSLGEIAVLSANGQQIVEIGWHVDPLVNEDLQPRLFVFHWIDGQPTCYNGCGFVQVSTTMRPGMRVQAGATAEYKIELRSGNWWLAYQGEDIGYFPGSLWTTPFTTAGYVQWFGEIAAATASTCSEMGNGLFGNQPGASSMSGLFKIMPGGQKVAANAHTGTVTNPNNWNVGQTTPTSFSFGGPGQSGGGCCTPQSCAAAMAQCGQVADSCGAPLQCGDCDNGITCTAQKTCGTQPNPGDAGVDPDASTVGDDAGTSGGDGGGNGIDDPSAASAGCCEAGQGATPALLPALGVVLVLRRRRRQYR
jgi:MYXO-CTERM domain-containing protein